MSALAGNSTSPLWQIMEGKTVNAVFPLLRFLGGSDHSGVFLTQAKGRTPAEVVLKIVPLIPTFAELQLSRWRAVAGLAHPHLLSLFEAGRCEIDGVPYLYALMERADQGLAELLKNRALADDEARETFLPALSALAYLHSLKLVHGQIKPSNILVVGDRLKLASDTVHPVAEYSVGVNGMSAYDPPEARNGNSSTAGDIWALGITMCEALTSQRPSGLHVGSGDLTLPPDMPPVFRGIVASCVRSRPEERLGLAALRELLGGEPVERDGAALPAIAAVPAATAVADSEASAAGATSATTAGEAAAATEAAAPNVAPGAAAVAALAAAPTPEGAADASEAMVARGGATNDTGQSSSFKLTIRAELLPEDGLVSETLAQKWRVLPLALAAVAVLALAWLGIAVFRTDKAPAPTAGVKPAQSSTSDAMPEAVPGAASDATPETARGTEPEKASDAAPAAVIAKPLPREMPPSQPIGAAPGVTESVEASSKATPVAVHEVIPDIPRSALNTIRGTIRVTVRVILDRQGTVIAASADDPGPSPYFARQALGAAKQWTFPPADSDAQRVMTVRFAFKRSGATALATTPR